MSGLVRPLGCCSRELDLHFEAPIRYLGYDGHPSTIYLRTQTSRVTAVDNLLAAQASPEDPEEAAVAQPSAVPGRPG